MEQQFAQVAPATSPNTTTKKPLNFVRSIEGFSHLGRIRDLNPRTCGLCFSG